MARRKRSQKGNPNVSTNKLPVLDDIPETDKIHELMKLYEDVLVRIQRRNDKGQLQTVSSAHTFKTLDLATIDKFLRDFSGGGDYLITVRSPNDVSHILLKFTVRLEGPPMTPKVRTGSPVPVGGQAMIGRMPPSSKWAEGLNNEQAREVYVNGPQHSSIASDRLAYQELTEAKARSAKLEEQLDQMRKQNELMLRKMDQEREELKLQRMKEQHENELKLLQLQMERQQAETTAQLKAILEQRQNQRPERDWKEDLPGYAALASALAPVFTAFVTTSRESQSKAMEIQQQGLANLMQATMAQVNRPDGMAETLKVMGPLLAPMLASIIDQKSPTAQAALFNALSENQLQSVAMMAQLIEAFAGSQPEEPVWLPMVREVLGGAVHMGQAMMEQQQEHQQQAHAQQMQRAQGTPMLDRAMHAMQQPQAAPEEVAPQPQQQTVKPPTAMNFALMMTMLPYEWRTDEWEALLRALHDPEAEPAMVGEAIATHVANCAMNKTLPSALEPIFEEPEQTLRQIFSVMPVGKDEVRSYAVIQAVIGTLQTLGHIDSDEAIDTDGGDAVEEETAEVAE